MSTHPPGRRTLLWMIPVNLLVLGWVWMGRLVFGVGGWFLLIFAFTVVPVLLLALVVSTVLAFAQADRPRHLTRAQARAQVALWVLLGLAGAVCPDFGDAPDSELSALTQVFGTSRGLLDASWVLTLALGGAAVAAYVVLVVLLTAGRQRSQP